MLCGAPGPLTKEHIIPGWLARLLARRGGPITRRRTSYARPAVHVREHPVLGVKVRGVCKGCNEGWMKDLEDATKPLLTPMIAGQRKDLTPASQIILATWLYKMCLLLHYDDRPPEPPPLAWRRWLFDHRQPPPFAQGWLAVYAGDMNRAIWHRRHGLDIQLLDDVTGRLLHKVHGDLTTLQIGEVGLQMIIWGGFPLDGKPFADERHLLRIWPPSDDTLSWPTPWGFDAEWMDRWATQWLTDPPPPMAL